MCKAFSNKKLDWRNHKWLHRLTFHFYTSVFHNIQLHMAEWYTIMYQMTCTQFVKVWWRYNTSKFPKKDITFHNLQSHLAYGYFIILILFRCIVCESLVKIQRFRHEWLLIKCKYSQKMPQNQEAFYSLLTSTFGMSIYQNICIN